MCYNEDLPGPDYDPDAWNDEDKQSDVGSDFEQDDNYVPDEDGLA